ncbi:CrcB family protein [soil metagenome]
MRVAFAVAVGSGLGGVARVVIGVAMLRILGDHFPFGVLTVNIAGSFLIGFLATCTAPTARLFVSAATRQFLLAGFCGGLTTFSFFSLQTMLLLQAGRVGAAAAYSGATLFLGLAAVWLGHVIARRFS